MAMVVWSVANLFASFVLSQPLPSFYTVASFTAKKVALWGLEQYFKSQGGAYVYIYKLVVNSATMQAAGTTVMKDYVLPFLSLPDMQSIPYVNLLPSSLLSSFITEEMKAKVLLMCTVESGKFAYSLISNPTLTSLNLAKMTSLQIEEVMKKQEICEYHSVEVDLNSQFENTDEEFKSILADWCMIETHQNDNNNNGDNDSKNNNSQIVLRTPNNSKNIIPVMLKNVNDVNNLNEIRKNDTSGDSNNNNNTESDVENVIKTEEERTPQIPQIEDVIVNNKQMKLISNYVFTLPVNEVTNS